MTSKGRCQRGTSLAEVLVTLLFATWLGAMLHEFSRAVLHSVRLQEERGWAQDTARVAIEGMLHELRLSGYSAAGAPLERLRAAAPDIISLQSDLNGDGDTNDSSEVITYRYDPTRRALMRGTGTAAAQPLLDRVPPEAFVLRYFDAHSAELIGSLDAVTRALVHRVEVVLTVEYPNPNPALRTPLRLTHRATVQLRNHLR